MKWRAGGILWGEAPCAFLNPPIGSSFRRGPKMDKGDKDQALHAVRRLDLIKASFAGLMWFYPPAQVSPPSGLLRIAVLTLWGGLLWTSLLIGLWLQALFDPEQAQMWAGVFRALSQLLRPGLKISGAMGGLAALWGEGGEAFASLWNAAPVFVLTGLVKFTLFCGVLRAALFPEQYQFGYLRFWRDEGRVLIIGLKVLLVFIGVASVGAALAWVGYVSFGAIEWLRPYADLGLFALMIAIGLGCVWLYVRLCVAAPATLAEERLSLMSAYDLSQGRGVTLMVCAIITHTLTLIATSLWAALSGLCGFGLLLLYAQGQSVLSPPFMMVLCVLLAGFVIFPVTGLLLALAYTPYARLYETLRH